MSYADVDLAPHLGELIELLEGSDMAALDLHARLRPNLRMQWPSTAEALEAALAGLDFTGAAGHCRALLREVPVTPSVPSQGQEIAA